jgi:hypothetical protein
MRLAGGHGVGRHDAARRTPVGGPGGGPVRCGQVWAPSRTGAPFRLVLWAGRDVIGRDRVRFREGDRCGEVSGAAWRAWANRVAAVCPTGPAPAAG